MKKKGNFSPKNILVRMPNWIGDAVCATPVLTDLRSAYPSAEITAMCQSNVAPLFEKDPLLNELFSFHRANNFFRRTFERNIIAKLQTGKYDLGILLTHSFSSAWQFWQGKVQNVIGFNRDGRRLFLDVPLSFPQEKEHMVTTYKRLLSPLGLPISETSPHLFLTEKEKEEARELVKRFDIDPSHILIGINPGAAYGTAKCWLPERFREVAKELIKAHPKGLSILVFGDLSQKNLLSEICNDLPPQVVNLAGQTNLRELLALIDLCTVFLTNDSGPMHIADALNTPLVALFGSTDPFVTGPYKQRDAVIQAPQFCSPCFKRICPIDFRCMKAITVEAVLKKIHPHLEREKELI